MRGQRDPQLAREVGVEAAAPLLLHQCVAKRVRSTMHRGEGDDLVSCASDPALRIELDYVDREAHPVHAEAHRLAQHSPRAARAPEAHRLLPPLQRKSAKETDHTYHVIAVQVCKEYVVERERDPVAHHLSLRAFAAVEHQRLTLADECDR